MSSAVRCQLPSPSACAPSPSTCATSHPKTKERSTNILGLRPVPTQQDPPFRMRVAWPWPATNMFLFLVGSVPHPPPPLLDSAGKGAPLDDSAEAEGNHPPTRPATLRAPGKDKTEGTANCEERGVNERAPPHRADRHPAGTNTLPSPRAPPDKYYACPGRGTPQATMPAQLKAPSSPVPPCAVTHLLCAVLAVPACLDENSKPGFLGGLGGYSCSATGATMAGDAVRGDSPPRAAVFCLANAEH